MATALDLITSSARLLGVVASGETLQASEATDGLAVLNALLDSWSNESLLIPSKTREVVALVGTQETYTIGTGGTFNTARPQLIEEALIQLPGADPVIEVPMRILDQDEYAAIRAKTLTSTFPLYLYNDSAYPLANLSVWPVPNAACNMVLYSWKPLANLAALTTVIALPKGYERALRFNLACDLAPEYGRALREDVVAIAAASKAEIKRMVSGTREHLLRCDDALVFQGRRGSGNTPWTIMGGAVDPGEAIDGGTVP